MGLSPPDIWIAIVKVLIYLFAAFVVIWAIVILFRLPGYMSRQEERADRLLGLLSRVHPREAKAEAQAREKADNRSYAERVADHDKRVAEFYDQAQADDEFRRWRQAKQG